VVRVVNSRHPYFGRVFNVRVDEIEDQTGRRAHIEVAEHRGGVAIIAQPRAGQVVLVRQYRPAIGRSLWEVPAGKLEPDEDPAACALRELEEETGYSAQSWRRLWSFYTAPGFCTERLHLFLATGLRAGTPRPDPGEHIETRIFDVEEAWRLVTADDLPDAKTQIALAYLRGPQ
jgi:ADP-ribose pyrophosphatase